jgi:hypothetical protein
MHKKVTFSSKKLNIPNQGASLNLALTGVFNDKNFDRPVSQVLASEGSLVVKKRGKSEHLTNFKKCKLQISSIELPRGSDAIDIDVTMGVPMTSLSIGQSKIGIGRSRRKGDFKKYKWDKLHEILSYGEQVLKAIRRGRHSEVHLLMLTDKNRPLSINFDSKSPLAKLFSEKRHKAVKLLLLSEKCKIITIKV